MRQTKIIRSIPNWSSKLGCQRPPKGPVGTGSELRREAAGNFFAFATQTLQTGQAIGLILSLLIDLPPLTLRSVRTRLGSANSSILQQPAGAGAVKKLIHYKPVIRCPCFDEGGC